MSELQELQQKAQIVYETRGKYIICTIEGLPCMEIIIYTGLRIVKGRKANYLAALKKTLFLTSKNDKISFIAPIGAIVHVKYLRGSRRKVYEQFNGFFVVEEGWIEELELESLGTIKTIKASNLKKLQYSSEKVMEIRAEILNKGLVESLFDNNIALLCLMWGCKI